jgi:hypothetical protein
VLVWFSVGTLLAFALQGGADLPYLEVAGGISVDWDEGLRNVDEAVDFQADGGDELVPVWREEGFFGFDFLCIRRVVGGVEECIDGIGVECVRVGRSKIVVG